MKSYHDSPERGLFPTTIDIDDIEQEVALAQFLKPDIKISKYIIKKKLEHAEKLLYFSEFPSQSTSTTPWQIVTPNFKAIDQIINWALEQSSDIQKLIWDFLDNPEEELDDTLRILTDNSLVVKNQKPLKEKISLSQLMLKNLPATKEELIELIQILSPETTRPAATVRQFTRRYMKAQKIIVSDQGVITHV